MRKIIFSVCFIFFVHSGLFAQCVNPANIYSFTYGGKNYELVKEKKSWTDASACAVSRGGYLVQIDDGNEQTAMMTALTASGISTSYNPITDGGGASYVWIGATDKVAEGTWIWDGDNNGLGINFWNGEGAAGQNNGTVVSGKYVNWGGNSAGTFKEPDDFGATQDGAALALAGWPVGSSANGVAGEWNDINTSNTNYYIIEYGTATGLKPAVAEEMTVSLYPNPAHSTIEVVGADPQTFVKIFSAQGELVYETLCLDHPGVVIPVDKLKPGMFLLMAEKKAVVTLLRFSKE